MSVWVWLAVEVVIGFVVGASAGTAIFKFGLWREKRRGDREAAADREDQGAGVGTGVSPYSFSFKIGPQQHTFSTSYTASVNATPAIGAGEGARLEKVESDTPIVAWKRARLVIVNGKPTFGGVVLVDSRYGVDDTARCYSTAQRFYYTLGSSSSPRHTVGPELTCRCGFYAVADKATLSDAGVATLEVELFGTVIEHEHGYRAGRQRVLSVSVDRQCSSVLCDSTASVVGVEDGEVLPFCPEHAALSEHSALQTPAPLASLAGLLGTEVRWAL